MGDWGSTFIKKGELMCDAAEPQNKKRKPEADAAKANPAGVKVGACIYQASMDEGVLPPSCQSKSPTCLHLSSRYRQVVDTSRSARIPTWPYGAMATRVNP